MAMPGVHLCSVPYEILYHPVQPVIKRSMFEKVGKFDILTYQKFEYVISIL